jgi:hypothetical protein
MIEVTAVTRNLVNDVIALDAQPVEIRGNRFLVIEFATA